MARILIVEDEPLISLLLEDWLTELGHQVVGPVTCVADALEIVTSTPFDAAILDVNLRHQRCDPVAEVLATKAIPYAFATGDSSDEVAGRYVGRPVVSKPYTFEIIRDVVGALLPPSTA